MTNLDLSPATAVRKIAAHSAERIAVVYENRPIRFAELAETGARLAAVLTARGIGRGDRIAYLGLNSPAFFASYLAWRGSVRCSCRSTFA